MVKDRWRWIAVSLAPVLAFTSVALAGGYVPGVTVTATGEYASRPVIHIVDGSGLTLNLDGVDGTHTVLEDGKMWLGGPPAGDDNPEVYFDLGQIHYIEYMMFWNYNGPAAAGIGVQEADIYYSTDSDPGTATWTLLTDDQVFSPGLGDDVTPFGQMVPIAVSARLIKLDIDKGLIDQTFPGGTGWTGISEVRFYDPNLCVNPSVGDIDKSCLVDLVDFAEFVADWLVCGMDPPEACF